MTSDKLQNHLQDYYARVLATKQAVQISQVNHISTGWENEVYAFRLTHGSEQKRHSQNLILRIYPGEDAYYKSEREFQGMQHLYQANYPVPQVLLLERDNSPLDKPFVVMERIAGQELGLLWFASSAQEQQETLTLFCDLLVQLHALDWRLFGDQASNGQLNGPYAFVDRELEKTHATLARLPLPGFLPILDWLKARRDQVPCTRPSVIHWDYHPNNILLRADGSAIVIDWTQVQVSDARFDLAWTLLLASSHIDPIWRDRILHEYERLADIKVEQLDYFEVFACLKRLYSVAVSMTLGPEKLGMRPEAAAMMKQQLGAISRVSDLLGARTGLAVPEVEALLAR